MFLSTPSVLHFDGDCCSRRCKLRLRACTRERITAAFLLLALVSTFATVLQAAQPPPANENVSVPPITPTTVQLPAAVTDLAVGGSGRFAVLHFSATRQLAVFDFAQKQITHTFPLGEDRILLAAGKSFAIVVFRESRLLQKWDLQTGERLQETLFPVDGILRVLVMGSASNGPMLVNHSDALGSRATAQWSFVDPLTFAIHTLPEKRLRNSSARDQVQVRAAANGRMFGMWDTAHSPSGVEIIQLEDDSLENGSFNIRYAHSSSAHVVPGPDGRRVFTGQGIMNTDLLFDPAAAVGRHAWCLPAHSSPLFLATPQDVQPGFVTYVPELHVRAPGLDAPLGRIARPEQNLERSPHARRSSPLTLDKRVIFSPVAGRIAILPVGAEQQLRLYDFDAEKAIEQSHVTTLIVDSQPPLEAVRGRRFMYRIVARSRYEPVTYRLSAGPGGMVLTGGLLTWDVPGDAHDSFARVSVEVSDEDGKTLTHGFVVKIVAAGEPVR